MTKPWLKLWHKILDSPKIQTMDGATFKGWINLLCLACREGKEGVLPDIQSIAFALRLSPDETRILIDETLDRGLLERNRGTLIVRNWNEWQAPSEKTSTDRVRQHRRNLKAASELASNGRDEKRRRNGDETVSVKHHETVPVTIGTLLEGEGEGEGEGETDRTPLFPLSDPADEGKPKAKPKKPAFDLPDWVPRETWDGLMEVRRLKKAPSTDLALGRVLKKLDDLRRDGFDPEEVLGQSIERGYPTVYPVHSDRPNAKSKPTEEPIKYHVAPADSPFCEIERQDNARLLAIFGGGTPEGGPPAAAEPRSGEGSPGFLFA